MSKNTKLKPSVAYHVAKTTKGKGGSLVVVDDQGNRLFATANEESVALQSRRLLKPIVDGLMYPGTLGVLAAPPKAGKSNLSFMLAHKLAKGEDYLDYEVKEPCSVLISEFEEGDAVMAARYARFEDDDNFFENGEVQIVLQPSPFIFVADSGGSVHIDMNRGLGLQIYIWNDLVKQKFPERPRVVFVDTLARAIPQLGGGKYSAELNYIGAAHELAEQLDIAIVFVHHTNKGEHQDAADAISGTNGVAGSMDWSMVVYRDNEKETKKRLPTGRLVCNSRMAGEDELLRWVKLSDKGFWEMDREKEREVGADMRKKRDASVPACVKKILTLMRHNNVWSGTATQLLEAINDKTAVNAITKYLNQQQEWLREHGIEYSNERLNKKRTLHLRLIQEEVAPDPAEDVTELPFETGDEQTENDKRERGFWGWLSLKLTSEKADAYIRALRTLRDSCAGEDERFIATNTITQLDNELVGMGFEPPYLSDSLAFEFGDRIGAPKTDRTSAGC